MEAPFLLYLIHHKMEAHLSTSENILSFGFSIDTL